MENFCSKKISNSSSLQKSSLSFATPCVTNLILSKKNLNLNNKKIGLQQSAFKTPNKTPLHLKQVSLSSKKKTPLGGLLNDRYIPNRMGSNMEASYHLLRSVSQKENQNVNITNNATLNVETNNNSSDNNGTQIDSIKRKLIIDTCNGIQEKSKILQIHSKQETGAEYVDNMKSLYTATKETKKVTQRVIPSAPERILDAPEFRDDYCSFCF